jgi:hypothetical protein
MASAPAFTASSCMACNGKRVQEDAVGGAHGADVALPSRQASSRRGPRRHASRR